jgi:GxxExxY protein
LQVPKIHTINPNHRSDKVKQPIQITVPTNYIIMPQFKYDEITRKIIGAAMKVHSTLGNGFQEVIYQRAMEIEMRKSGLLFVREFNMPIFYDGEQIGERRVDFFVEGMISVELKAREVLEKVHYAQARNYLEAYNLEVGLLLNFGNVSLEFKRLENPKYNPNPTSKKSLQSTPITVPTTKSTIINTITQNPR